MIQYYEHNNIIAYARVNLIWQMNRKMADESQDGSEVVDFQEDYLTEDKYLT